MLLWVNTEISVKTIERFVTEFVVTNNNDPLVTKKKTTDLFVFKKNKKIFRKNPCKRVKTFFFWFIELEGFVPTFIVVTAMSLVADFHCCYSHVTGRWLSLLLQPCHWPLTSDCGPMETTWTKRTRSPGVVSPTRSRLTTATGTPASPTTWQGIRTVCSSSTPSTTTSGETSRVPSAIPSSAKWTLTDPKHRRSPT